MSVTSKKARAKKRLSHRRFAAILAKGGHVVMHPDTLASLRAQLPIVEGVGIGDRIEANRFVPRGQLVAVAPLPHPSLDLLQLSPPNTYAGGGRLEWHRGR